MALNAESTGLRVRKEKIKVTRANNKKQNKIKLNGEDLEDVERFLIWIVTEQSPSELRRM